MFKATVWPGDEFGQYLRSNEMIYALRIAGQTLATVTRVAQETFAFFDGDATARAYLNGATDRIDLELRMRELDRPRRTADSYQTNFSMH
jgi:hypothetical protein